MINRSQIWPIETFNENVKLLPSLAAHELKQISELFMSTESFNLRITRPAVLKEVLAYLQDNIGFCNYSVRLNQASQIYVVSVQLVPVWAAI